MIPDLSKANIYIICGRTDLRKGIDSLAAFTSYSWWRRGIAGLFTMVAES